MQAILFADGPLPLGDPSGTFLGTSKKDIGKMLTDSFLNPTPCLSRLRSLETPGGPPEAELSEPHAR